ncbi:MAG: J domain-containing protein [Candidatus Brocadiia bacterium]
MAGRSHEPNYYQVLGVTPEATPEQIKRAYRRKARLTHPDLQGPEADPEMFRRVKRAYEVLGNPEERARYNALTGLGDGAGNVRFYRRSFDRLFANLFRGLRAAMETRVDLSDEVGKDRRKAG